jgi:ABC-type branched-subunit amino acid transport system substrate-binding protein
MANERHDPRAGEARAAARPARRGRWAAGGWAAGAAAAGLACAVAIAGDAGCSLVADSSTSQCDVDDDCAVGKGLADTVCDVATHLCVRPAGFCQTNQQCVDAAGPDDPAMCIQKRCQRLKTEDCTRVMGTPAEYANDNAVVVGYMSLTAGNPLAPVGSGGVNAVELARSDFVKAFGGLPPAVTDGPVRPLVVVACNEVPDPLRPARHLVETLKVPALIGPIVAPSALSVVQQVTIPNDVLNISPTAATIAIAKLDDRGLVWRTDAADAYIIRTMSLAVAEFEKRLRGGEAPVVTGEDGLKVAYFHRGDILSATAEQAFLETLTFNGKVASANLGLGTYRVFDYGDFVDPTATAAKTKQAIDDVIAYRPHVIVQLGVGEMVTNLDQIEKLWPADAPYRPNHVLYGTAFGGNWQTVVGTNEPLRQRILGAIPLADPKNEDNIVIGVKSRYDSIYKNDMNAVWSIASQASYDAMYLFSFAAMAAGDKPLTGPNLVEGMKKIAPPGTLINGSNPLTILDAAAELRAGKNINYHGALGNILFDAAGEFAPPIIVWCVGADNRGRPTGWVLDKQTGVLEGQNTCF